jgi:hypothetical protein
LPPLVVPFVFEVELALLPPPPLAMAVAPEPDVPPLVAACAADPDPLTAPLPDTSANAGTPATIKLTTTAPLAAAALAALMVKRRLKVLLGRLIASPPVCDSADSPAVGTIRPRRQLREDSRSRKAQQKEKQQGTPPAFSRSLLFGASYRTTAAASRLGGRDLGPRRGRGSFNSAVLREARLPPPLSVRREYVARHKQE